MTQKEFISLQPEISTSKGRSFVNFSFPNNETVQSIVSAYASGDLAQPVRKFASCRSYLFRCVRDRRAAQ